MGKRLALWLTENEVAKIEKLRKEAEKDRRSLNSYCKKILFNFEDKQK